MTNFVYDIIGEWALTGQLRWRSYSARANTNMKLALIAPGYTADPSDRFMDAVPAATVLAAMALTGKRVISGRYGAANKVVFIGVPAGRNIQGLLLFNEDPIVRGLGTPLAWYDTGTGLPNVSDGGDLTATWEAGWWGI